MAISKELVDSILRYDPDTGSLYWKNGFRAGKVAGGIAYYGRHCRYIRLSIGGKKYLAHRIARLMVRGVFPTNEIDHIDGNGLNNKISNLREATKAENLRNKRRYDTGNRSSCTGVALHKKTGLWQAYLSNKSLGYFRTEDEAIAARRIAATKDVYNPDHGIKRTS